MPSLYIPSNFSNKTGYAWSAFFRLFSRIAKATQRRGLGVVWSFAEVEGPVEILGPGIPHESFLFDPLNLSVKGLLELRRNIRRHDIRWVYWTDFATWHWVFTLMRIWGVKRIVVHSHISVQDPLPAARERGWKRLLKTVIHRSRWLSADYVITCSAFVRDRLVNKACLPPQRVSVIHYGLPDSRFEISADGHQDGGPLKIFCSSRATRVKGIHVLIEATRQLVMRHKKSGFLVEFAGTGPDLDDFKARVADAGLEPYFGFLGYLRETNRHLAKADIVVIPSIWGDAFPYSVLEAMAAARAIVATSAGGIPEQLGDASCGRLVPPGDAFALADALSELLDDTDLRRGLGQNAGRRARLEFREEDYFEAVIQKLAEVLDIDLANPS